MCGIDISTTVTAVDRAGYKARRIELDTAVDRVSLTSQT